MNFCVCVENYKFLFIIRISDIQKILKKNYDQDLGKKTGSDNGLTLKKYWLNNGGKGGILTLMWPLKTKGSSPNTRNLNKECKSSLEKKYGPPIYPLQRFGSVTFYPPDFNHLVKDPHEMQYTFKC